MKQTFSRRTLNGLNALLAQFNLRLDTLTAARQERRRLQTAVQRGWFAQPPFALLDAVKLGQWETILTAQPKFQKRFASFAQADTNDTGYCFDNIFYGSPDAEVLYTIVHEQRPARIVEIGCGHSTKIIRQAIRDGGFACQHTCIDPQPRQEVAGLADEIMRQPIETVDAAALEARLRAGDVLFIDTSHEVKPANDVAFIYGTLLPRISPGVIVHIHDVFLPYDYPQDWVLDIGLTWGEQYIVQALLQGGAWDVLWPGYYLQRTLPDFSQHFPHVKQRKAQSLWLRRR